MNKPFKALRDKMSPESQQRAATMTRELLRDELIGFGKSASKTADWIVDTYLPGAHVGTRISLENAIAECILDRVEELEQQRDAALKLADLWKVQAIKYPLENATSLVSPYTAEAVAVGQAAVRACANELRAIFEPKEGK